MGVGEAPGPQEHAVGRPFVGLSGFVLNSNLESAGLSRSAIFISNVYPYFLGRDKKGKIITPTPDQVEAEEEYIVDELLRVRPTHVLAMGGVAITWFLEKDVAVSKVNGLTFKVNKFGRDVLVTCAYHPAAGLYTPDFAGKCWFAFKMFALSVSGKIAGHTSHVPKFSQFEAHNILGYNNSACDTETLQNGKLWCVTVSRDPGESTLLHPGPGKRVELTGRTQFHYASHDMRQLNKAGFAVGDKVDCSLQMAYVLQTEPKGLKELVYRWLGWELRDYDDVVGPHHRLLATAFLEDAISRDWPKPEPTISEKTGKPSRPHSIPTRVRSVLKAQTEGKAPAHKRWIKLPFAMRRQIQKRCGKFPPYDLRVVPVAEARKYAMEDSAGTSGLTPVLKAELKRRGLWKVYALDRSVLPMFAKMEEVGLPFDVSYAAKLSVRLQSEVAQSAADIRRICKDPKLNPSSPDQLAYTIYEDWGLPAGRMTKSKSRASTDDKALRMLVQKYGTKFPKIVELQGAIDNYRECEKFDNTFVQKFLQATGADGRLRFTIKPATVFSGRISTTDPNVLSMPTRSTRGKLVKNCVAALLGFFILSVDLSQMELRTAAHLSRDPVMCKVFNDGKLDLHTVTGSKLFGIPYDQLPKDKRYVAKTINFAVLYGITPFALYEQLILAGITAYSVDDCEAIIADWFRLYAGVRNFLDETYAFGRRHGYVEAMGGRRRYCPNLALERNDMTERTIAAAEREAGNHPVQGTASGFVLKRAQRRVWEYLKTPEARDVECLLQFHDELLLMVPQRKIKTVAAAIKALMEADQKLFRVPLKAEAGWAERWGDAKP